MPRAAKLNELALSFFVPIEGIELSATGQAAGARSWIQVARVGTYQNATYGEIDISRDDLSRMLANFKTEYPQSPYQLPFDYDHLSTKRDRKPGDGVAAGWFLDMEVREHGTELWAQIEWTPPAVEKIRNKEYRYCSPTFFRQWATNTGKQIGTTMIAAALTNYPFLNMAAITLSNDPDLASRLALPKKQAGRTGMSMKTITVKDKDGNDVEVNVEGISLDMLSQIPAVKELQDKLPKDGQQVVKADDLASMNQRITELSTQLNDSRTREQAAQKDARKQKLAALKRSARIDGADETYGNTLIEMENGAALFDQWYVAMSARKPMIHLNREHGAGGEGDDVKTEAAQAVELVEQYEKDNKCGRREAIKAVELSHPGLIRAYREDIPDYQTAKPIKNVVAPVR